VKWNLEPVAKTTDFGNFEPEMLATLLQQNDVVIHNEMALYRYSSVCSTTVFLKRSLNLFNVPDPSGSSMALGLT
jgi:hypothetical protein